MNTPASRQNALSLVVVGLLVASAVTVAPVWVALVLSAWFAILARPLLLRLSRWFGGRSRAAAVLIVVLLVLFLTPLALAAVSLLGSAVPFVENILRSPGGKRMLATIVMDKPPGEDLLTQFNPRRIVELVQEHGARALQILRMVAGVTVKGFLGVFLFVLGGYTFLVDGPAAYQWAEERAPLAPPHFRRLAEAFAETGRGLVIGVGLTALIQGILATVAYLSLRIPGAFTLGLLTCIAALVPSFGTALIWVPVAAGLAITGRWIAALVLVAIGVLVIGTVDNLLRPFLSRFGRLRMPTYALFVAIFGGMAVFGTWGFILGPLVLRLTMEALELGREARTAASLASPALPPVTAAPPSAGPPLAT